MTNVLFSELGLSENVLRALEAMSFEAATPIQAQAIPLIRKGADIIAKSQTGTGKTVAFGIPVIEEIDLEEDKPTIQALILCPTRELAQQAAEELKKLSRFIEGISPVAIYGGAPMDKQCMRLRRANIVVGTPGRVMDHMRRKTIKLNNLKIIVLDEADEMLSMGFKEDIETILKDTPESRQTVMFSATMPPAILALTENFQKSPQSITIDEDKVTIESIEQSYIDVPRGSKNEALISLFNLNPPKRTIIFCNTKKQVDELCIFLEENHYSAEGLHGDMKQAQRTYVMHNFKKGRTSILVATDIAARGIDVNDIDYVINYDLPQNTEYYVHRIGRTGRAGKYGKSITLCCGRRQIIDMKNIAFEVKSDISPMKLPKVNPVRPENKDSYAEEMRMALSGKLHPMYLELVTSLSEEGFSLENIAGAALQLHFSTDRPLVEKPERVEYSDITPLKKQAKESTVSESNPALKKIKINLGKTSRIAPNHIVGAITERTGIPSKLIGKIDIFDDQSVIEIPHELVDEVLESMVGCKICDKTTTTELYTDKGSAPKRSEHRSSKDGKGKRYGDKAKKDGFKSKSHGFDGFAKRRSQGSQRKSSGK